MSRKFLIGQQNWRDCTENDFFDIPDFEEYEINIYGDVYKKEKTTVHTRNRIHYIPRKKMKPYTSRTCEYYVVSIGGKHICLHKLLAKTFLPNPNNYTVVDHLDSNKRNNDISNLEWCSHAENTLRAYKNNLIGRAKKIVCVETGKVFCNASEAGRFLGNYKKGRHITQVLRGERKTAFGYSWKYYEE